MIVPSIDLEAGRAVQLVGGAEKALDGGDPLRWMETFARVGEVAVVDLDAALGAGDNTAVIEELCSRGRVRVGGGIRSYEDAVRWLDRGADKVVLGTRATPELLRRLPRERVVAALDCRDGEVVVDGWRRGTGRSVVERMRELRDVAGGFLVTFVEREGRLGGTALDRVPELVRAAGDARVTIAGGVTTPADVAALDELGADAQVGMALYTGRLDLADAVAACLRSDRADGLWPTVVTDESGIALGLAYSSARSLREALRSGTGVYESRRRGLWRKGETSGAEQRLLAIDLDCDRDTLRFTVRQRGAGFCHRDTLTCWGQPAGLVALERTLAERRGEAPSGSYAARLFEDDGLLSAKLREEAGELADARTRAEAVHEAADVLFFTLARLARDGVRLSEVERELDRRSLRVTRRAGDAKEVRT
ncbi:MAG: phosphoribosyl-ATP diphosphatase [Planctomycetota bacterium]